MTDAEKVPPHKKYTCISKNDDIKKECGPKLLLLQLKLKIIISGSHS